MIIQPRPITLKDGRKVVLRSAAPEDAKPMIAFLRQIAEETHFLMRYPEEAVSNVEQEKRFISALQDAPRDFMLCAYDRDRPVGNVSIRAIGPHIKVRHRGGLGISVIREYWSAGLGTVLMEEAIRLARELSYEQVELGVYSDNERARHLYEKTGFRPCGAIPHAFRLKDGTYRDEIQMVRTLD